ncbi:hypothetical protein CDAR_492671 [Caerostris darwini]|uniref:Uncharacterized protein n=1 Tax=Caerostris darwini TaxID=1538125 RepID=A0AAV4UZZ2_9ARAC|nr:hypothetical protein CDAR_492671 [Caerostris darwini]
MLDSGDGQRYYKQSWQCNKQCGALGRVLVRSRESPHRYVSAKANNSIYHISSTNGRALRNASTEARPPLCPSAKSFAIPVCSATFSAE